MSLICLLAHAPSEFVSFAIFVTLRIRTGFYGARLPDGISDRKGTNFSQ
jgi:hypothetical protein